MLAVGLLVATPWVGRADDELTKFVEQNRIIAQKVKSEAAQAMSQARALEKQDAEEAQALLQKALKQVQNSTALSASDQTQLTAQLLGRLREVGDLVRQQRVGQRQAPLKELPKKSDIPASGNTATAQKFIEKANAGVDAHSRLTEEKNKGFAGAVRSIASASVPQTEEVKFPKDWANKTKLREKYAGPQLTAKEVALIKALNSVMSVDFQEKPFRQVLDYLMERTGQAIIVDEASRKEANTEYSDPVNFKIQKATFRTILRKVLADNGLTYVIKEGTLQVVTPAKAREMMVVRTYTISDIVQPDLMALRFGPFVARAQMLSNVQTLVNMIQSSVEPTIWRENGGGGSITFIESAMALVIRAPAEFHYQMGGGGLFAGGSN
jgi:hypothetical protein